MVVPFLQEAGLVVPDGAGAEPAGREQHTSHLAALLAELQEVARLYPRAEW
jgi:1,2-phenylacetyl-CoA epoxidase catalytic subunit